MNASEKLVADYFAGLEDGERFEVLSCGWPDLLVVDLDTGEAEGVEVKTGRDFIRPGQARMHRALASAGLAVALVEVAGGRIVSVEDAVEHVYRKMRPTKPLTFYGDGVELVKAATR